jgi:hypothetical protein
MTKGRGSNLIGVTGSAATRGAAASGAALGRGGFAATGLTAAATLGLGFVDFTGTFVVAMGMGLAGGLTTFFLGAATFGVAFLGVAFPGRLAALLGFFEGILDFRLLTKERAIIPTQTALYRSKRQHISPFQIYDLQEKKPRETRFGSPRP